MPLELAVEALPGDAEGPGRVGPVSPVAGKGVREEPFLERFGDGSQPARCRAPRPERKVPGVEGLRAAGADEGLRQLVLQLSDVSRPVIQDERPFGFPGQPLRTEPEPRRNARGDVAAMATGDYGSCIASNVASQAYYDPLQPGAGVAWGYLVIPFSNACGDGTPGYTSAGSERAVPICP